VTDSSGIVPRAVREVLTVYKERCRNGFAGRLRMTIVEVYGNDVNNLLEEGASVGAWHGVAARAVLESNLGIGRSFAGCFSLLPDL